MEPERQPQFPGFEKPTQNWSKLPHTLINSMHIIETLGEMKVILYILRHTWGFSEFNKPKKITLDEFMHGRRRADRTRMDNGTGLAKTTVLRGLERAIEHGFIIVETVDYDQARIQKLYQLNMSPVYQSDTPEVAIRYPRGTETIHRTEKETLERNPRNILEDSAAQTAPPPSPAKPKKPKLSQHPAIQAYRSVTNLYPPKPWHQTIVDAVGDSSSKIERWRQVVIDYQGMGWNKRNVKTMLEEYFLQGRMPGDNGNGHRNNGGFDPATMPHPVEDGDEILV